MTIIWHVDDLMISHTDSKAVTQMIEYLQNIMENSVS